MKVHEGRKDKVRTEGRENSCLRWGLTALVDRKRGSRSHLIKGGFWWC